MSDQENLRDEEAELEAREPNENEESEVEGHKSPGGGVRITDPIPPANA